MPKLAMSAKWLETVRVESRADFYDEKELGLLVRVAPSGTKTFYFGYRVPKRGRQQKAKLGRFPDLSLAQARTKAAGLRIDLANGNFIQPEIQVPPVDATIITVEQVFRQYVSSSRFGRTSRSHRYDFQRSLEKDVLKKMHDEDIRSVTRLRWMDTVRQVEKRGSLAAAARLFTYLKTFLNWAEDQGYVEINPIARSRYEKPGPKRERRNLTIEEIRQFWLAIDRGRSDNSIAVVLRLALLTGQRIGEIAGMQREELDLDRATWTLPARRAKNRRAHAVPLGPKALAIIDMRMLQTNGDLLFPVDASNGNARGMRTTIGSDTIGAYLRHYHEEIGTPPEARWTAHELRHSFVTGLNELGVAPHIVEALVNHVSGSRGGVAGVYNHAGYDGLKCEAILKWEAWLDRHLQELHPAPAY